MKKKVLLTGASGSMGIQAIKQFSENGQDIELTVFSLPTQKDKDILAPYMNNPDIKFIWGDVRNKSDVKRAVDNQDYILHVAAVISPFADHHPKLAWDVNYHGAKNIIDCILQRPDRDKVRLVTIGSVAMTGNRAAPYHFGRIGDPLIPSAFDYYALSKIAAERYLIMSGLKHWVSLRQTGIMHEGIFDVNDGIGYHMPLDNHMEWVTAHDSGRLLFNLCHENLPDHFWRKAYNISGGKDCRWLGIDFLTTMYQTLKVDFRNFENPNYYAFRNFHGQWYEDADVLESYLHFRSETIEDVLARIKSNLPMKMKMLQYLPSWLVRSFMKRTALKGDTPLAWINNNDEPRINAFLKSRKDWESLSEWSNVQIATEPESLRVDHGYDESKSDHELNLEDMKQVADFRGGKCLSESMVEGDMYTPLEWECAEHHRFWGSPYLILKAGHWCDKCTEAPWNFDHQAKHNQHIAQVWYADHDKAEDRVYGQAIERELVK